MQSFVQQQNLGCTKTWDMIILNCFAHFSLSFLFFVMSGFAGSMAIVSLHNCWNDS